MNPRRKEQLRRILKNPLEVFDILNQRKQTKALESETDSITKKAPFQNLNSGLSARSYDDQETYIRHQAIKYEIVSESLEQHFQERLESFKKMFAFLEQEKGKSILCLGARDGSEVKALRDLGLLAIGIDLNYKQKCPYVHFGDFHNIPYPAACFDYVYTNTLDHMADPRKLFAEIHRILKPEGQFVAQILNGTKEGYDQLPGDYESFVWETKADLIKLIEENKFTLNTSEQFNEDWWMYTFKPQ